MPSEFSILILIRILIKSYTHFSVCSIMIIGGLFECGLHLNKAKDDVFKDMYTIFISFTVLSLNSPHFICATKFMHMYATQQTVTSFFNNLRTT
uniref:Uncharacterized protein n=1 Tax=Glossina palpalis gambiensis TaxID=67801 RepID=A0A1B0AY76_9MUSC